MTDSQLERREYYENINKIKNEFFSIGMNCLENPENNLTEDQKNVLEEDMFLKKSEEKYKIFMRDYFNKERSIESEFYNEILAEDMDITYPIDLIKSAIKKIEEYKNIYETISEKIQIDSDEETKNVLNIIYLNKSKTLNIKSYMLNYNGDDMLNYMNIIKPFTKQLLKLRYSSLPTKDDKFDNYINELNKIYETFTLNKEQKSVKCNEVFPQFSHFFDSILAIKQIRASIYFNYDYIIRHFKYELENVKKNFNKCDFKETICENYKILNDILNNTIIFSKYILNDILTVYNLMFKNIKREKVKVEVIKGDNLLINRIESLNPFLCADYHLLRELRYNDEFLDRTNKLINFHNKFVKNTDYVFYLGDITESEFYTDDLNDITKKLIFLTRKLNGKKILLTGNNDIEDVEFYKKCGFLEVYKDINLESENFTFSHKPMFPIKKDNGSGNKLNIHGHIHGAKIYYCMDYRDHIDVYHELWNGVYRLNDINNFYKTGKYKGCFTDNDKTSLERINNFKTYKVGGLK